MPTTRSLNDPARIADCRRLIVRHVQCRSCGYEPAGAVPASCPKCRGGCWEKFVQLGKLGPANAAAAQAAAARLECVIDPGPDPDAGE